MVDRLRRDGKWRNLAKHPPARLLPPEELDAFLAGRPPLEMVFHLGAVSETTATDGDPAWATNVELPLRLWHWCAAREVPFVYASSAATYGDGSAGSTTTSRSARWSGCARSTCTAGPSTRSTCGWRACWPPGEPRPPQWAGLKFFNVYGPNEYHKGGMISVVKVKHDEVAAGLAPRLFRSDRPGIADGEQRRDFIWVGDVVDVMLWLLDTPAVERAVQPRHRPGAHLSRPGACGLRRRRRAAAQVEFIDMPDALRGQYQSFTQAPMARLRAAGYAGQFTPLEEGVRRYVQDYLAAPMALTR